MKTADHERFADDVGAYLLGALDDAEERAFAEHMQRCDACREEVVRLEVARDALPRSVEQVAPPEGLKSRLMTTVRDEVAAAAPAEAVDAGGAPARSPARRSRWRGVLLARPRYAALAAAALLAVGVGIGALAGALGGGDDSTTVAARVDQTRMPAAKASLVVPEDGGALLHVEGMQQPQAGHVYEVWIQRGDKVAPSSLFSVARDGSGTAGIPEDLEDADAVLVTSEPSGGSMRPSEAPVVTVPLRS